MTQKGIYIKESSEFVPSLNLDILEINSKAKNMIINKNLSL